MINYVVKYNIINYVGKYNIINYVRKYNIITSRRLTSLATLIYFKTAMTKTKRIRRKTTIKSGMMAETVTMYPMMEKILVKQKLRVHGRVMSMSS